jgi:hypothetical protein
VEKPPPLLQRQPRRLWSRQLRWRRPRAAGRRRLPLPLATRLRAGASQRREAPLGPPLTVAALLPAARQAAQAALSMSLTTGLTTRPLQH